MDLFSIIAHNVVFGLLKVGVDSGYSQYEVYKDALRIGQCEFPSHLAPKFSVSGDGSVAIYGGCNAYLINIGRIMISFQEREEVSKIWFFGESILLACDTLLAKRSRSELLIQNEYWHSDIIVSSLLTESSTLVFQDLQNGVFQLNVDDFSVTNSDYPFIALS